MGGRRPGPFQVIADSPPVDLSGTAAAEVAFTEYRRGSFRIWHARDIPGDRDEAVWRAVRERVGDADLVPLLGFEDELNDYYYEQFVSAAGEVDRPARLSLEEALAAREARLGPRADQMRASLASATPSEEYRSYLADADEFSAQMLADPEYRPRPTSLTVFRGPIEEVALFLTTGRGRAPDPVALGAALRRWQEAYGAVLLRCDGDSVQLEVSRPPRTLEELREAAWQIYLIGPSDPVQAFGATVERADELLASLEGSRWECSWYVD